MGGPAPADLNEFCTTDPKEADQSVLDALHDSMTGLFDGSVSMEESELYEKMESATWNEISRRWHTVGRISSIVSMLPIGSVLLHRDMPMIAFQIGVFYFYAAGRGERSELPQWMRHVIIYGDNERYTSIKRLAFRHGNFSIAL